MLGGVFISYRREDSSGSARGIYDRLARRLGRKNVFFDVDNIPPGVDFVDTLSERVGKCHALIAVIGADWVSSVDEDNQRRIDNPHDFVRMEIEAALERGVRVIPALVDGAVMPRFDDLPDSLKKLVRRQGIEISHSRFDSDVKRLIRALSLLEEELRQREAAETERGGTEKRGHREAGEAADKPEGARQLADAEAPRAIKEQRVIRLELIERAPNAYISTIRDRTLFSSATLMLDVWARRPLTEIQQNFPTFLKVGPTTKMNEIVHGHLPGVAVVHLPTPPPQIRAISDHVYFYLDRTSPLWPELSIVSKIGMHFAGNWPELQMELLALREDRR
jgi:hypothetical protein